jgi:hypothetical protein
VPSLFSSNGPRSSPPSLSWRRIPAETPISGFQSKAVELADVANVDPLVAWFQSPHCWKATAEAVLSMSSIKSQRQD